MSEGAPPVPDEVRQLETLLARLRRLAGELLNADAYDRWGPREGPERDAVMARMAQDQAAHQAASAELAALVTRLRQEAPEMVARWAEAHEQLLAEIIAGLEGAPESSWESTAVFVARGEQREWAQVRRFERLYVSENAYYVRLDPQRVRDLLGVDP